MIYNAQKHLPIFEKYDEIIHTIQNNQVIIISGETGSGKTTHLPLFCFDALENASVVCTQPRRIAAISLANYVSTLCNCQVGADIGFRVRFRENVSESTRIQFVTDGILLNELSHDPLLKKFNVIIIDEAHERTVNIDLLIGYIRTLLPLRPDLKLIISSATIDTRLFSKSFGNAPVITVYGRLYPVDIQYRPVIELWKGECMDSYLEGTIIVIQELLVSQSKGDILIFLPTVQDINDLANRIESVINNNCRIYKLHSKLPVAIQNQVFKKFTGRKIIIATNIAETSITIPGIRFVIDSGLVRMLRYEPSAYMSRMPIEKVSKASAQQRAGRCGRVEDGVCYRLYSENDYESRPNFTTPEIRRANLASIILKMSSLGMGNPNQLPFLQNPSPKALQSGYHQLRELGAIDKKGNLTYSGKQMARLPLDPPVSKMLIYAREHNAVREMMVIAAGLSVQGSIFLSDEHRMKIHPKFRHQESDFMVFLKCWFDYHKTLKPSKYSVSTFNEYCRRNNLSAIHVREWLDAYLQIRRICRTLKGFMTKKTHRATYEEIHKSLLAGFFFGLASKSENSYTGLHCNAIHISPVSMLFGKYPKWVLMHDIVETTKIYGRMVAEINPIWVENLFRTQCRYSWEDPWFNPENGHVQAREEVNFKGLELIKNRQILLDRKDPEKCSEIFIKDALIKKQIGDSYRFIQHNAHVFEKIVTLQNKLRRNLYLGDWALEEFYRERLNDVKNQKEMNALIKKMHGDSFLFIPIEELLAVDEPVNDDNYPDFILVANRKIMIHYCHCSNDASDGFTLDIPEDVYKSVPFYYWDWVLPAYWKDRVQSIIQFYKLQFNALSISTDDAVAQICENLKVIDNHFVETVCRICYDIFDIMIYPSDVYSVQLPHYHWPIIRVLKKDQSERLIGRLPIRKNKYPITITKRPELWEDFVHAFEQDTFIKWEQTFLKKTFISMSGQIAGLFGYIALCKEKNNIASRMFFSYNAASRSHADSIRLLLERALETELSWELETCEIKSDIKKSKMAAVLQADMNEIFKEMIVEKVLQLPELLPFDVNSFDLLVQLAKKRCATVKEDMTGLFSQVVSCFELCSTKLEKLEKKRDLMLPDGVLEQLSEELFIYGNSFLSSDTPISFKEKMAQLLSFFVNRIEIAINDPAKYKIKMKIAGNLKLTLETIVKNLEFLSYEIEIRCNEIYMMVEMYLLQMFSSQQYKYDKTIAESDIQEKIEELRFLVELQGTH
jgi:ATP-dependent helicase HrpA